jgi:hypothetical protein
MAESNVRVVKLQGHYGRLVDRYLERVERAAQDSSDGLYSPTRWLSDAYASWSDLVSAVVFPIQFASGLKIEETRLLRQVDIAIQRGTDEAVEAIVVPDPGDTQLVVTDLLRDKVPVPAIRGGKAGNIDATLGSQGRVLIVRVHGLSALNLLAGEYSGTVSTQKNPAPFAEIRVKVTEPANKGP